jgi:hypothetical protein
VLTLVVAIVSGQTRKTNQALPHLYWLYHTITVFFVLGKVGTLFVPFLQSILNAKILLFGTVHEGNVCVSK